MLWIKWIVICVKRRPSVEPNWTAQFTTQYHNTPATYVLERNTLICRPQLNRKDDLQSKRLQSMELTRFISSSSQSSLWPIKSPFDTNFEDKYRIWNEEQVAAHVSRCTFDWEITIEIIRWHFSLESRNSKRFSQNLPVTRVSSAECLIEWFMWCRGSSAAFNASHSRTTQSKSL